MKKYFFYTALFMVFILAIVYVMTRKQDPVVIPISTDYSIAPQLSPIESTDQPPCPVKDCKG